MRPRSSRLLALTLLAPLFALLVAGGCAKRSYSTAAESPGYYGEEAEYYDEVEGDYDYAEDMVMVEGASIASRGRSGGGERMFKSKRDAAPPSAPDESYNDDYDDYEESGEAASEPEPLEAEAPAQEPRPQAKTRQVIYTAAMEVSVYDLPAALAFAEEIPARYGGWMQQREDNQFVVRIPAAQLARVMDRIAELGVVELRTLDGRDVTDAYTDLDSRIRVLEQMQVHLEALLAKAKTVEQSLEVRKALDAVTLELEALRAQMRSLAESIAFSTLVLRLSERGPAVALPSSNDPFDWVDQLGAEATEFR